MARPDGELELETPDPPATLPYAQFEDYRAQALLEVNAVAMTVPELLRCLEDDEAVLRGAAAHTLGALGSRDGLGADKESVRKALTALRHAADDLVEVEAAFALVRLGVESERDVLRAALEHPVGAYLSPAVAAGDLARLGDPVGIDTVARCLDDENLIVRTIGCKQLYFFAVLEGTARHSAAAGKAYAEFARALHDESPDVQHLALTQLKELPSADTKRLLSEYAARKPNAAWEAMARRMLSSLSELPGGSATAR